MEEGVRVLMEEMGGQWETEALWLGCWVRPGSSAPGALSVAGSSSPPSLEAAPAALGGWPTASGAWGLHH